MLGEYRVACPRPRRLGIASIHRVVPRHVRQAWNSTNTLTAGMAEPKALFDSQDWSGVHGDSSIIVGAD